MKKNLLTHLILAATLCAAAAAAFAQGAHPATAADTAAAAQLAALGHLPADVVVPARLPAAIQDPALLEAWVRLDNHTDPIQLWDGRALTGRGLAEFLLAQGIAVVWDAGNACGGGSCSVKHCAVIAPAHNQACDYAAGQPILVRPAERGDMPALVATLAHEAFHRTQPFGAVADTRFEEYWAFRIEYHITPEAWLTFGAYDPLDPNHLSMWIRDNGFQPYFQLPAYPASVAGQVVRPVAGSGGAFEGLPAAALGNGQGGAN